MKSTLHAGDLVEVLDASTILGTLDADGAIDRMPFMPEMLQYCGRQFRISKVAHKTCDVAHKTGARSLTDCFHLEDLRCDGSAHGGCQATCLIFWKRAWLKRVGESASVQAGTSAPTIPQSLQATTRLASPAGAPTRYSCQATRLIEATSKLHWWDPRAYLKDLTSRNVPLALFVRILVLSWFRALTRIGIAYKITMWIYNRVHRILMAQPASTGGGLVPQGVATPTANLDLVPGEKVVVKSHIDIRKTLGPNNRNRGLWFDQEYVPFCGTERRVSHRVTRILDERTGEMLEMKNPCIVLEGVKCEAHYSFGRLFCPRAITAYWREAWLERPREEKP